MIEHNEESKEDKIATKLFARPNGPLLITGEKLELVDENGNVLKFAERFSICRCGHSASQPFCDGSHNRMGFIG